jgi:hypothetical protein
MGYGFDLDEWVDPEQIKTWRDHLQARMGWPHFLGGRPEGPNRGADHGAYLAWNRNLDYASYEHHRPTYEVYLAALAATPDRPVMSEDRFRVRVPPRYPAKDYSEELTRRGLYDSTLAGGVANIWGHRENEGRYPNPHVIKTYDRFFREHRRFLPDMAPANQVSADDHTRVLHSPSQNGYVFYRENAGSIRMDLSGEGEPLPAVAVDTKQPYTELPLGELAPAPHTITLPHTSDWAVAVGRFGGSLSGGVLMEDPSTAPPGAAR